MYEYIIILFINMFLSIFWSGVFFSMNWAFHNSRIFKYTTIFCRLVLIICFFNNFVDIHVFLKSLTQAAYVFLSSYTKKLGTRTINFP